MVPTPSGVTESTFLSLSNSLIEILTSLLPTSELGQTYLMIKYVLRVELYIVGSNKLPRINSVESKRRVPPGQLQDAVLYQWKSQALSLFDI